MKEQHAVREVRDQRAEQKQEQRSGIQVHAARLPAQQWVQLLRQSDGLLDLPVSLLEQLAETVGNSDLGDLLRQHGGGVSPILCTLDELEWGEDETEVNNIQTAPPMLFPFPGWPEQSGTRLQPARPGRIRDRG